MATSSKNKEQIRLKDHYSRKQHWLKWGPYLSERQWGTVREDYSDGGSAWDFFPHDHARSRVYRWGEDGLGGISDEYQRMCFALALWNGKDPILKERLFGLTGTEGNHGEDVKELYYYLDNTPTHSYMKFLYKYPQAAYPYDDLVHTNRNRSRHEPEYELLDTGLFNEGRYFDIVVEYAKADTEDLCIKITVANRGPEASHISVLPTLWFRNLWGVGKMPEKPTLGNLETFGTYQRITANHPETGSYYLYFQTPQNVLFTENETNYERLFGMENEHPYVKDAFHQVIVENDESLLAEKRDGTKFAAVYQQEIPAGGSINFQLRLSMEALSGDPLGKEFDKAFTSRIKEADAFYNTLITEEANEDMTNIQRQAFAGLLWTKQYYNIDIPTWLNGDPGQPAPPESRKYGRNHEWQYLNNEDIISMPDKWEYPWYAAWDLAFHCVPLALVDAEFAKHQLILILREWYMAPNGQIPAYEWAFSDVNPPVQAWAALKVYEIDKQQNGKGDITFLKRVLQKLMLNFTWWVNRKDSKGNNIFEGGFLGLDNIGVFDRSNQLPGGGTLEQADGTSWMAMYSLNLLQMALEISQEDPSFEDIATKFFEHFVYIAETLNKMGDDWTSLWDEEDGFYYDVLRLPGEHYVPIKVRSLVGLTPLFATMILPKNIQDKLPDFMGRLEWFWDNYIDKNPYKVIDREHHEESILLSMVSHKRLKKLLTAMLDEAEFLAPGGIRSVSRYHGEHYYSVNIQGVDYGITYEPGESTTGLFGGNSNWRGPIWMPMNYLLIESLRKFHDFFGAEFQMEYPTGSGKQKDLGEVADALSERLISIFQVNEDGSRPVNGATEIYQQDPHFQNLVLFYEYFHGDNSRGVGASHQTGWTGVVAELIHRKYKI